MKLPCAIVQDLLPVYEEELCSPESREAVREHLSQCPHCARSLRPIQIPTVEPEKQEKAVARSFRKVRRRWIASILLVLILLPLLGGVGYLGWNEYHKEGICFSNLDEIRLAYDYVDGLEKGQYQKLTQYREYTDEYESIKEALSLTWQDNMPDVRQVQLGDSVWMAEPDFARQYLQDTSDQIWLYLIYNGANRVLIPTSVFRAAVKDGASEGRWDDTIYETGNGYIYASFQTQWGSFMVEQNSWSEIMTYSDDPVMLCYVFALYPMQLYEENLEKLEEYAKSLWQSTQDWNAPYRDMSLEEYTVFRNQEFVSAMGNYDAQRISVENKGFADAYMVEGVWIIKMNVTLSKRGEDVRLALHLWIKDGKVSVSAVEYGPKAPYWSDAYIDSLM